MDREGVFPFGQSILPQVQKDRTPKRAFILGGHSSAVYARWFDADGHLKLGAVPVASEPGLYWRGSQEAVRRIIAGVDLPVRAGRLEPASAQLNGPAGAALDDLFLGPLGLMREDVWLCDLVPSCCLSEKQASALRREYDPVRDLLGLPTYEMHLCPRTPMTPARRAEIEAEVLESGARVIITLGDDPLKWFCEHYGAETGLSAYGRGPAGYGRLHAIRIAGTAMDLLPLVHPRQAAAIGGHAAGLLGVHEAWRSAVPTEVAGIFL